MRHQRRPAARGSNVKAISGRIGWVERERGDTAGHEAEVRAFDSRGSEGLPGSAWYCPQGGLSLRCRVGCDTRKLTGRSGKSSHSRGYAMTRSESTLKKKTLRVSDTWRNLAKLRLVLRLSLRVGQELLPDGRRVERELRQKPSCERQTRARAAVRSPERRKNAAACAGVTKGALVFPIVHWIRDVYPETDSVLPIRENLPMGMSAESTE